MGRLIILKTAIDRWIAPATECIATCLSCGPRGGLARLEGCTFGHPEASMGRCSDDGVRVKCEMFES